MKTAFLARDDREMAKNDFDGVSLRVAIREAGRLGVGVRQINRTGELLFFVAGQRSVRVNCRKKDAPRKLCMMLRDVAAERGRT